MSEHEQNEALRILLVLLVAGVLLIGALAGCWPEVDAGGGW